MGRQGDEACEAHDRPDEPRPRQYDTPWRCTPENHTSRDDRKEKHRATPSHSPASKEVVAEGAPRRKSGAAMDDVQCCREAQCELRYEPDSETNDLRRPNIRDPPRAAECLRMGRRASTLFAHALIVGASRETVSLGEYPLRLRAERESRFALRCAVFGNDARGCTFGVCFVHAVLTTLAT